MPNWKKVITSGSDAALNSLLVTNGITGSLLGTASTASFVTGSNVYGPYGSNSVISASYAANGGVTQLLAGPNITLSPTTGKGQVTISSTGGGGPFFNTATGSYGSFYDTTTQTNPVGNVPRSMSFNTTDITNGVSISGSTSPFNTYIKTENPGVYDIQFSAQLDKTDAGKDEIVIWLRKNGIDLTDTATSVSLTNNNDKVVAAWNWFVNSAANDYYQIIWYSADTDLRLLAETAGGGHPGIPSVIATVNRVDQFLSNTGSFSGSFTGVFTGSLLGTASYATQALSSSYAVTASYVLNAVSASYASQALSSSYALSASHATSTSAVAGTTNYVSKFTSGTTIGDSIIFDTGTNIGIGTTSPQTKLDVDGSITILDNNNISWGGAYGPGKPTIAGGIGTGLDFYPSGSTSGVTMRITAAGNVGIGTTSPSYKLDVYAASSSDGIRVATGGTSKVILNGDGVVAWGPTADAGVLSWDTGKAIIKAQSGYALSLGANNTADQLYINTSGNVGIGTTSPAYKLSVVGKMDLNDGGSVFIGTSAGLVDDATSNNNVGIGVNVLKSNIIGDNNTAVGRNSMEFNLASGNTAIGSYSQASASLGTFNTSVGTNTLFANASGSSNVAFGSSALRFLTSGSGNAALGTSALYNNTTGSENTGVGTNAGRYFGTSTSANTNSSASIFIGRNSRANASGETNQIVIGNEALGLGSNTVVLGNDNIVTTALKGNVGIGTITPASDSGYKSLTIDGTTGTFTEYRQSGTALFRVGVDGSRPFFYGMTNAAMDFFTNTSLKMRLTSGGSLLLGDTIAPNETAWFGTAVFGKNGTNKVITGYLASSTNGAVIGGHNSALDGWAPLNIDGTELRFNIQQSRKMTLTSGGSLLVGATSSIWETSGRGVVEVNGSSTSLIGLSIAGANSSYLYNDGANLFLWNTLNGYMALATNNTTRMTIAAGGALRLHTYGSGTNTGTATYNLAVDSSGNVIESTPLTNPVTGTGVNQRVALWNGTTTQTSSANLTFDGSTLGLTGALQFPQNPVGTTYGNGVSASPPYAITQGAGNDDAIKLYAESAATNQVSMVFEVNDDIETAGSEWIWRNKKTYDTYAATTPMRLSGTGAATFLNTVTALGFIGYRTDGGTGIEVNGGDLGPGSYIAKFADYSNNPKVVIKGDGNVGIGETGPNTPLYVQGGGTGTGGWNKTMTLSATYPGLIFNSNSTKWGGMAYDHSEAMRFWVNAGSNDIFAGTLAMSILNNGKVGIGVTTPSQLLEVGGRALVNQFQYTRAISYSSGDLNNLTTAGFYDGENMTNSPTSGWFWVTVERHNSIGDTDWIHQTATSFGSGNTANLVYTRVRSNSTWGAWKLLGDAASISGNTNYIPKFTSGTAIGNSAIYDNSGNIGIGLTNADTNLDIIGDSLTVSSESTYAFRVRGGGGGKPITISSDGSYAYIQSWSGGPLQINNQGNDTLLNVGGGSVGIGTTSLSRKLNVAGTIGSIYGSNQGTLWLGDVVQQEASFTSYGILDYTLHNGGGYSPIMRVQGNGRVGIGTTDPSQTLHVVGNLRVEGAFYDSSNLPGTSGQILSSTATGTRWVSDSSIPNVKAIAIQTSDGILISNSTTNTISNATIIPANTFPTTCVMDLSWMLERPTPSNTTTTTRVYFNTSNSLTGATLLATGQITTTQVTGRHIRQLTKVGSNFKVATATNILTSDLSYSANALTTFTLATNQTLYLLIAMQNGNTTVTSRSSYASLISYE